MIGIRIISTQFEVLGAWRNAFKALEQTEFRSISLSDAQADSRFVCLLMPAAIVYDRLGHRPILGRSEIFDAKSTPELRMDGFNYIATTVPFPGKVRLSVNQDGSQRLIFEPKKKMTRQQEVEKIFKSMLSAIEEYNDVFDDAIPGIVVDLDVVNSTQISARTDAAAALQAIQHHRAIGSMRDKFNVPFDQYVDTVPQSLSLSLRERDQYKASLDPRISSIRQFYITNQAMEDAAQFSLTRGEVIDAALAGDIIHQSLASAPHSVRILIVSKADIPGRFIEIRGVLDEMRHRLTIQHLRTISSPR